ncbi:general transcription factor 3C polypeptide 6 [Xenentodon cancila]
MEDDWEEEEQLVVVELSGIINNDFLSKCKGSCKILDIDSEKPMMQIGQFVFAGEYEDALGTCVLFEDVPQKGKANSGTDLKYMCHTVKKLMMQRIFVTEKKEAKTSPGKEDAGEQRDTTVLCNKEENVTEGNEDNTDMGDSSIG